MEVACAWCGEVPPTASSTICADCLAIEEAKNAVLPLVRRGEVDGWDALLFLVGWPA